MKNIFSIFLVLVLCTFTSSKVNAQCVNGLEILTTYTNIGGNGGVSLTASATALTGPGTSQFFNSGTLYRLSKNYSSISNGNTFGVTLTAGSGDVMVRVIGYTSAGSSILILSAKKVYANGNIYIRVCDKSVLSGYSQIRFEVYGMGTSNGHGAWSWT